MIGLHSPRPRGVAYSTRLQSSDEPAFSLREASSNHNRISQPNRWLLASSRLWPEENDVLTNLLYQPPISGTFASVITFFHLAMSAFT
jgi:hypothetical protein